MEEKDYGDHPRIPRELLKDDIQDKLEANPTKRSGNLKKVRHNVKELLKNLIK